MALTTAKCTKCGNIIEVEETKDAAICPFCNEAYVVARAIRYYKMKQERQKIVENSELDTAFTIEMGVLKNIQDVLLM